MARIKITYCKPCGYAARAQRLAAALDAKLGLEAELVAGTGGIFEVSVDDKVVVKRARTGFPTEEDVLTAVAAAVG
ncbi:MAG TPA: SelT/SelW/SelH family protein [Burkholderiales bacterium]|nr:SelT/SelW/SelH family protein [Burkholderiales bacterium]